MYRGPHGAKYKGNLSIKTETDLEIIKEEKWTCGVSYDVELFPVEYIPVILIKIDKDTDTFIERISNEDIYFSDFEYTQNISNNRQVSLFSFYTKSGIYIFKQYDIKPSQTFRDFLYSKKKKFIVFDNPDIKGRLNKQFGTNLNINLEDVYLYLNENERSDIYNTFEKYGAPHFVGPQTQIDFATSNHSKWNVNDLKIYQVVTIAFRITLLSKCYKNMMKAIRPMLAFKKPQRVLSASQKITSQKNDSQKKSLEPANPKQQTTQKEINVIQFSNSVNPNNIGGNWKIGKTFNVVFFPDIATPVSLIALQRDNDIRPYLSEISKDKVVFIDSKFKNLYFRDKKKKKLGSLISIFSFACSSGVYLFKSMNNEPNKDIKNFLKSPNIKFVGIHTEGFENRLKKLYGKEFSVNIEDVAKTRLSPREDPTNFYELVQKYASEPAAEFNLNLKNANWGAYPISISLVLYAAFKVFALKKCFPSFPPPEELDFDDESNEDSEDEFMYDDDDDVDIITEKIAKSNENIVHQKPNNVAKSNEKIVHQKPIKKKDDIIRFENGDLNPFALKRWEINEEHRIEFFDDELTYVVLLDGSSDISEYLKIISKDEVIFADFEYVLPNIPAPPVCLFQFCCSSGCFIFKQKNQKANKQMEKFLSISGGNKFVAKGIAGDLNRLTKMFGPSFVMDIEDVEDTRLGPYGESKNFDQMVSKYAGTPTAQFKDKKVSTSRWDKNNLNMKQVIYSAFDVVSLYKCYPNFNPVRKYTYKEPKSNPSKDNFDIKNKFIEYLENNKVPFDKDDFVDFWNENSNLVAEMLKIDLEIFNILVNKFLKVGCSNKFGCNVCQKSDKFEFFSSFMYHCKSKHDEDLQNSGFSNVNFKSLFCIYLNNTGRISSCCSKCWICNKDFGSKKELKKHCWIKHYNILNELFWKNNPQSDKSGISEKKQNKDLKKKQKEENLTNEKQVNEKTRTEKKAPYDSINLNNNNDDNDDIIYDDDDNDDEKNNEEEMEDDDIIYDDDEDIDEKDDDCD